jgi:hypothetical protein
MRVLFSAAVVLAGSLEPIAGPTGGDSQMYTLDQIYNRINNGAAANKETTFKEPSSGPMAGTGHTLNEIMGKLPSLDDANGAGPGNVTQGKTYWGLTSGQWGLRTGTMPTPVDTDLVPENIKQGVNIFGVVGTYPLAGVARSGQNQWIPLFLPPFGSDGDLHKGVVCPVPRFTDNGIGNDNFFISNGTVTDNLTGLIWLKSANCSGTKTWSQALTWVTSLANGSCGLSDGSTVGQWRLPNVREMQSLIHYGFYNPALSNTQGTGQWTGGAPFTGILPGYYWLSTMFANDLSEAWLVDLRSGIMSAETQNLPLNVWAVRGGH